MSYVELRSDYQITKTTQAITGTRSWIDNTSGNSTACVIEDLPVIGDAFSVAYPTCLLRSLVAVPYHYDHVVDGSGSNEDKYKYLGTYSSEADPNWEDEKHFGDSYTGGTSMISLDLRENKPNQWFWVKEIGDEEHMGQINKRSVFYLEAKGTYTKRVIVPQDANEIYCGWGKFLTGGGVVAYGIMNCLGKINSTVMTISGTPGETETFNLGQLLFTSFNAKPGTSETGLQIWYVDLNFAYRSIDVGGEKNVDYPWLYLVNDNKNDGENDYQLPIRDSENYTPDSMISVSGVYLYDFSDLEANLDPTL